MATLEQVEKLRQYANITYDEAKSALDQVGGDMLEAVILLEKQGKISPPKNGGYYCSRPGKNTESRAQTENSKHTQNEYEGEKFGEMMKRFFRWLGKLIHKGCINMFEVRRHGNILIALPIIVLIILLLSCFWIVVPLIIVGLFFGCRYRFCGKDFDTGAEVVNKVMDSASDFAENIKNEVKEETGKNRGDNNE